MIYEMLGRKLPWKEKFKELSKYAGYHGTPVNRFLGFLLLFSLTLAAGTSISVFVVTLDLLYALGSFLSVIVVLHFLPFGYFSMVSNRRASEVDEILPDALQLMAANIRAGMTTERAIWLSARPEFGPLQDEIHRVSSKVMGGKPLSKSLKEMSDRIDSELLDRAVKLMTEGIRSGGEMATLLDETAGDIRTAQNMKKKVKANVTMYSMFIVFASVIGAPLLFALSVYFIEVTSSLWVEEMVATEGLGDMGGAMLSMEGPDIDPSTLKFFSIGAISVTTFFGGMIIGMIQEGNSTSGLKYSPFMLAAGLAVFFVANILVTRVFGGFVGL
ncbi:MAG: type II secretion system F family protein [Candidatus Aenigmatarchaeota archaeon]